MTDLDWPQQFSKEGLTYRFKACSKCGAQTIRESNQICAGPRDCPAFFDQMGDCLELTGSSLKKLGAFYKRAFRRLEEPRPL